MINNKKRNSFWLKTIRRVAIISISQLLVIPLFFYAQNASAVSLKSYTEIESHVIHLSDIFDGLPRGGDRALGAAPLPGKDMTINARTLYRVALSLGLDWKPKSSADYVVIRRKGTFVDEETIQTALNDALKSEGLHGLFRTNIPADAAQIILAADQPGTVEIDEINWNKARNTFEATMFAPSKANAQFNRRISGTIEKLVRVPSVKSTMTKGDVIRNDDISYIEVPERYLNQDYVMKAKDLIGTTPRRFINPSEPVKANEIEFPKIVERGQFITMIFKNGPLQLSARGKALENGAKGDLIRVVNMGSSKTLEAIITADSEVTVQTY